MALNTGDWKRVGQLIREYAGVPHSMLPEQTEPLHVLWKRADEDQRERISEEWKVAFVRRRLGVSLSEAKNIVRDLSTVERKEAGYYHTYNLAVKRFQEHIKRDGTKNVTNWRKPGIPSDAVARRAAMCKAD